MYLKTELMAQGGVLLIQVFMEVFIVLVFVIFVFMINFEMDLIAQGGALFIQVSWRFSSFRFLSFFIMICFGIKFDHGCILCCDDLHRLDGCHFSS